MSPKYFERQVNLWQEPCEEGAMSPRQRGDKRGICKNRPKQPEMPKTAQSGPRRAILKIIILMLEFPQPFAQRLEIAGYKGI